MHIRRNAASKAKLLTIAAMPLIVLTSMSTPALAEEAATKDAQTASQAADDGIAEIVVTAQRRSENLQRTALSVTAISAEQLASANLTQAEQLTSGAGAGAADHTGPGAVYELRDARHQRLEHQHVRQSRGRGELLDGVPLVRPTTAHGLFYDLERVEVLEGAQGTLYGRNATGGAINVITNRPTETFGGDMQLTVGNYGLTSAEAAVNLPIDDKLALRAAGQTVHRDGYYSDGTDDEIAQAGRLSLEAKPTDQLTILAVGDYSHDGGKGPGATVGTCGTNCTRPISFLANPWTGLNDPKFGNVFAPYQPRLAQDIHQNNRYDGGLIQVDWATDLGTLTVIPAYRKSDIDYVSDVSTFYIAEVSSGRQYTMEGRFATPSDRPLSALVGAFYLDDKLDAHYLTENQPTTLTNQTIENTTQSAAAFGSLTQKLSSIVRLTGSARYTDEQRGTNAIRRRIVPFDFAAPLPVPLPAENVGTIQYTDIGSKKFPSTTWKAGVEWDVAPQSLLYANVGTGFKSGGFFFGVPGYNSFGPEKVTNFVIGSKNRFLDNRLQINAEAFLEKYRDQQVSHQSLIPGVGQLLVTDNAGRSTIKGLEAEAVFAPLRLTRLTGNVQYLEARYDSFTYPSSVNVASSILCPVSGSGTAFTVNCSGFGMVQSPKWVIGTSVQQRIPLGNGNIVLAANTRYEATREADGLRNHCWKLHPKRGLTRLRRCPWLVRHGLRRQHRGQGRRRHHGPGKDLHDRGRGTGSSAAPVAEDLWPQARGAFLRDGLKSTRSR